MSRFWRIVFAWILVLALPLQGYAAHAKLFCGPAHHGVAAPAAHTGVDHAGHATHADADLTKVKAETAKTAGAGKCSACASCCSAVAITSALVQTPVIAPQSPIVATVPAANDCALIAGLERPPRPSLA